MRSIPRMPSFVDIRRHSKAIEQNDESMSTSAKLTSTALSDLDKLWWNRQKQFADRFVVKTNEKAQMLAEHEVVVTTACSDLKRDCTNVGAFISGQVSDNIQSSTSKLWDLANMQTKYARGTGSVAAGII